MLPSRRAVALESEREPSRKATSTPSLISAWRWSFIKSTIRSFGCRSRNSGSLGISSRTEKLDEAATRTRPRTSPVPRAA